VTIAVNETNQAIQKIDDAVKQSGEIDDVDKRDIRASLDLIRDLAGKDATPKSKQKITEKLAAVVAMVESCEKLAPVVKPLIAYLKTKFSIP